MKEPENDSRMVEMSLHRIVYREHMAEQYIHLVERGGERGFPIVIGKYEAMEIQRVVRDEDLPRPLTHKLAYSLIESLGHRLATVDIVDLRDNTFHARIVLQPKEGDRLISVDARPSDAIALALRARCPIRVSESVLEQVRTDRSKDKIEEQEEE